MVEIGQRRGSTEKGEILSILKHMMKSCNVSLVGVYIVYYTTTSQHCIVYTIQRHLEYQFACSLRSYRKRRAKGCGHDCRRCRYLQWILEKEKGPKSKIVAKTAVVEEFAQE